MSKKKTADFIVGNALQEMCCFGESRHEAKLKAKAEGKDRIEGIFSYETYHYYRNIGRRFYEWARIRDPRIRGIPDAAKYVGEYVKYRIDSNLSAWTISSEASALCKLCRATREELHIPQTPPRRRADIKAHRNPKIPKIEQETFVSVAMLLMSGLKDEFGIEERDLELIKVILFCKATGCRRHELKKVNADNDIYEAYGNVYCTVKGKGGKIRHITVLPEYRDFVRRLAVEKAGQRTLFAKSTISRIPDVHAYRREYAQALYKILARPLDALDRSEKYYCRAERRGVIWDREAMLRVSKQLGHNRISVIAESYL